MLTVDGEPVEDISTATTTNTFPIYKSAAVAKIQGVYLKKTDSTAPTLLLPDAVFDLQRWDGTQYVHDRTITTSSTAASVVDKLECGTAYRLTETQAPVDYNLDSTPYEFALKACEAPTGLKPDGWHGVVQERNLKWEEQDREWKRWSEDSKDVDARFQRMFGDQIEIAGGIGSGEFTGDVT